MGLAECLLFLCSTLQSPLIALLGLSVAWPFPRSAISSEGSVPRETPLFPHRGLGAKKFQPLSQAVGSCPRPFIDCSHALAFVHCSLSPHFTPRKSMAGRPGLSSVLQEFSQAHLGGRQPYLADNYRAAAGMDGLAGLDELAGRGACCVAGFADFAGSAGSWPGSSTMFARGLESRPCRDGRRVRQLFST